MHARHSRLMYLSFFHDFELIIKGERFCSRAPPLSPKKAYEQYKQTNWFFIHNTICIQKSEGKSMIRFVYYKIENLVSFLRF